MSDKQTPPDAEEILRSLRRIVRAVSLHSHELRREAGLTVPQLLCLRAIQEVEPTDIGQSELSERVKLAKATITGIVDRLERAGLVERHRDIKDRRRVHVRLTPAGREHLGRAPLPLQERFSRRITALPGDEQSKLLQGLERIVELLEAEELDASPILETGEVSKAHTRGD
jgi:DNA-binding MarR family transcriptional regulator